MRASCKLNGVSDALPLTDISFIYHTELQERYRNEKNILIIISSVAILLLLIPQYTNNKNMLMKYIDEYFNKTQEIILIDYSDGGAYVYMDYHDDSNVCFFMKKSYFGWKYDFDVHNGILNPMIKQCGFSITKFKMLRNVDYPVYFGKIIDDEIVKVTFENIDTKEIKEALIYHKDDIILWTYYFENDKTDDFIMSAHSANGELISEVEILSNQWNFNYYKNIEKGLRPITLTR